MRRAADREEDKLPAGGIAAARRLARGLGSFRRRHSCLFLFISLSTSKAALHHSLKHR